MAAPSADPASTWPARSLLSHALRSGAALSVALLGSTIVGAVVSARAVNDEGDAPPHVILALGVEPAARRKGLAVQLLAAHVGGLVGSVVAEVTLAERDPIDPLPVMLKLFVFELTVTVPGLTVTSSVTPVGTPTESLNVTRLGSA